MNHYHAQHVDGMHKKDKGGHWMESAVKHPGALHRELGVAAGKKIPRAKLAKAAHSSNPTLRKRAVLAETFAKFRKGE
jgi:hypothetical protein